ARSVASPPPTPCSYYRLATIWRMDSASLFPGDNMAATRRAGRSGVYVRQTAGYRALVPAPLPPQPPAALDGELRVLLSRADRALGRLDGSVATLPNPDLFVFMYVRKEAVLSSQI